MRPGSSLIAVALLALACGRGADDPASDDLRAKAIGARHPSSGAFAPVREKDWTAGSWTPGAHFVSGEGSTLRFGVYSAHATRVLLEIYSGATGNTAGVKDPVLDKMIDQQKRTVNEAERIKLLKDIQWYIVKNAWYPHLLAARPQRPVSTSRSIVQQAAATVLAR